MKHEKKENIMKKIEPITVEGNHTSDHSCRYNHCHNDLEQVVRLKKHIDMDDLEKWINDWIVFATRTRQRLADDKGFEIDPIEFQEALAKSLGKAKGIDLVYLDLPSVDAAIEMVKDYPFEAESEPVETISLDESVLPSATPQLIEEETIKSKGEVWRIHANDADTFPSSPHAHHLGSNLKLHLGTGILYRKGKEFDRITCKKLRLIRDKMKKIDPPKDECDNR